MNALTRSFVYDRPRGEACCELGKLKMEAGKLEEAVYWYTQALTLNPDEQSGAFVQRDCYGYLPSIQLCVCYDRLGDKVKAAEYNERAGVCKPDSKAVGENRRYFNGLGIK